MDNSSFASGKPAFTPEKRNINKVPFVELFNDRLQGVVSSGSDLNRVYVSFFETGSLDFYCSTNNNRPCSGLRGRPCKHLLSLLDEAIAQYGIEEVVRFLKISGDQSQIATRSDIIPRTGGQKKQPASEVFSRFLHYLRYLELEPTKQPVPEMSWFV